MIHNASVVPSPTASTPNVARRKRVAPKKPVVNDNVENGGLLGMLGVKHETPAQAKAVAMRKFNPKKKKPVINDWKHVAGGATAGAVGGATQGALFGSVLGPAGTGAGAIGGAIAGSIGGGVTGYVAPKATRAIRKLASKKKKKFTPKTYVPPVENAELIANLRDFEDCLAIVANAWTDEARAAALETRRQKARLKFQQEGNTRHQPYYHEKKAADYYRKGMQARRGGTFTKPDEDAGEQFDEIGRLHEQRSMDQDYNAKEAFFHKQVELEQRDLAENPPGSYGRKATKAIVRGTVGSAVGGLTGTVVGRTLGGIAGRVAGGALGSTATGLAGGIAGATLGSAIMPGIGTVVGGVTGAALGRGVGRIVGRSVVSKLAASKGAAQAASKVGSATAKTAGKYVPKFLQRMGTAASAKAKDLARVAGMSAASPNVAGRAIGQAAGQRTGATVGAITGGLTGSVVGGTIGHKSGWEAAKRDIGQRYLDTAERERTAYEYHAMRAAGVHNTTLNGLLSTIADVQSKANGYMIRKTAGRVAKRARKVAGAAKTIGSMTPEGQFAKAQRQRIKSLFSPPSPQ